MATIGQPLLQPEPGWKRYDDNHTSISYNGIWTRYTTGDVGYCYNSTFMHTNNVDATLSFRFYGNKLRIVTRTWLPDRATTNYIIIDDVEYTYTEKLTSGYIVLVFEKLDLDNKLHTVVIGNKSKDSYISIDAIDINEDGYIVASIGNSLLQPEEGWRRYLYNDPLINRKSDWVVDTRGDAGYYSGSATYTTTNNSYFSFYFYGSKIRIVNQIFPNRTQNAKISIDDVVYTYDSRLEVTGSSTRPCVLLFEKNDLDIGIHKVSIYGTDLNPSILLLECIDIDSNGYLAPYSYINYKLKQKTSLQDMEIGDIIPCRYTAPISGRFGYFSELGTCEADFIDPNTSSATPDGKFHFVKVSEDKLIADRNVQHSITWNELNNNGIIDGKNESTSVTFNGTSSYVSIPISTIKYTDYISYRIRLKGGNWSATDSSTKILSCTQTGGFGVHCGNNKFNFYIAIGSTSYYGMNVDVDASYNGERILDFCYTGSEIKIRVTDVETGVQVSNSFSKTGSIVYGSTSHMTLCAEPGSGTTVEAVPTVYKGEIIELIARNTNDFINDDGLDSGELFLHLKPQNISLNIWYDISPKKLQCTMYSCNINYNNDSNILTVPAGGVTYSSYASVFPKEPMTSSEDEYAKVTSSNVYSNRYNYRVFDMNNPYNSTEGHWMFSGDTSLLLVEFKTDIYFDTIYVHEDNSTSAHYSFNYVTVEGSNDGIAFETIQGKKASNKGAFAMTECNSVNGLVKYKFVKFTFETSAYAKVGEIRFVDKTESGSRTPSIVNQRLGGWPVNNDWDKYIWKGNLDGKIVPSDSDIWNYSKIASLTRERLLVNVNSIKSETVSGTKVSNRGYCDEYIDDSSAKRYNVISATASFVLTGFRPMIVLKEGV